jgi:hypothetical protein
MADPAMAITLILDTARLWRWHLVLVDQLAASSPGRTVAVSFAPGRSPLPLPLSLALMLEGTLDRRRAPHAFDRLAPPAFAPWHRDPAPAADLVIDLATGGLPPVQSQRMIVPLFGGAPGEAAFWSALLDGAAPKLDLYDNGGPVIVIGQPAIESPHALRVSAAAVATRIMTGIVRAAGALPAATVAGPRGDGVQATRGAAGPAMSLLARKVASKARRLLDRQLQAPPQWAVAWRQRAAPFDPLGGGLLDPRDFQLLPDDGRRYYADPFLVQRGESVDMFVEELPYATGRGLISVATIAADGSASVPRPVLEAAHHLSYPQVFHHGGAIWMLPEAHQSGGLTLYRATRYPDAWEPVARLIDEPVHDATLFEHGGRLWIAATTQGPQASRWGSSWDGLSIYSAATLLGPWTAHPGNPVLIDAASARPAGPLFAAGGLIRPVQDCSRGYGLALRFKRITRLDGEGFAEEPAGGLSFAAVSSLGGPHTLARLAGPAGMFEAIDVFAARPVFAAAGLAPRRTL